MLSPSDEADIEKALRHAINDAYRLGLGAAIAAMEILADRVEPASLQQAIAEVRRISLADAQANP
jgi:hypothetical protein